MTPAKLASYVRFKTRTNSSTFTDSDILLLLNVRLDEIARRLLDVDENIFVLPTLSNLVANQREYPFDSQTLARMVRVEAKLDGTNWKKLTPMSLVEYRETTDESGITTQFDNDTKARYFIARRSLWIYSGTITEVANGLKMWLYTYPKEISDLTSITDMSIDPSATEHGLPRELHELLARGVVIDYKNSREKPIPLTEMEQRYDTDLQMALDSLSPVDLGREVIADLPSATDRGDEGFNY